MKEAIICCAIFCGAGPWPAAGSQPAPSRSPAQFQPLDRVALSIGNQAITELQIDEELRVTALLNHQPLVRDRKARRAAASRMVEQVLIRREADVSRFPAPDAQDIDKYEKQVERDYGGRAALQNALQRDDLSLAELREHLAAQLETLRFIDIRFRPEAPATSDATLERRADEALAVWLTEERRRSKVVFVDKSLE